MTELNLQSVTTQYSLLRICLSFMQVVYFIYLRYLFSSLINYLLFIQVVYFVYLRYLLSSLINYLPKLELSEIALTWGFI